MPLLTSLDIIESMGVVTCVVELSAHCRLVEVQKHLLANSKETEMNDMFIKAPHVQLQKHAATGVVFDKDADSVAITATLSWNAGTAGGSDLDFSAERIRKNGAAPAMPQGKGLFNRLAKASVYNTSSGSEVIEYGHLGSLQRPPFIEHGGDALKAGSSEVIRIARPPEHDCVLLAVYQARGNGAGSLWRFEAKVTITDNQGTHIVVPLHDRNENRYWVAVALVDFTNPNGYQIRQVEEYSQEHSERRPLLRPDGTFLMDQGREYFAK